MRDDDGAQDFLRTKSGAELREPPGGPVDGRAPPLPVERPPGSTVCLGPPGGGDVVPAAPGARRPGRRGRRRRGSWPPARGRPRPAAAVASASAWRKVGLSLMPPSTRSVGDGEPGVGLGRLHEVGAALGDPLEHGPHDLRPPAAAGEAEQRAPGAVVPARACRGRAGPGRTRRRRLSSQRLATSWLSAARVDDAEVVAEPLDVGAGRQHDRLDAPGRHAVAAPGHDREAAARRPARSNRGRSAAEVQVEHAAGAEGDLGLAGRDAALADAGCDCWSPTSAAMGGAPSRAVAGAEDAGGVDDGRAGCARGMRSASRTLSSQPLASPRSSPVTRRVGGVGDVEGALGEVPGQPGVDGADAQVAACGRDRPSRGGRRPWWPRRSGRGGCRRPGARGTCRRCAGPASRCPGPTGSPVARSHTMVDARWLVMPTASTGPASASTGRASSRAVGGHDGGVELAPARARATTAATAGAPRRRWWRRAAPPRPAGRSCRLDDEDGHGRVLSAHSRWRRTGRAGRACRG